MPNLRKLIQKEIAKTFTKRLGTLVESVVFVVVTSVARSTEDGSQTPSETEISVKATVGSYSLREITGSQREGSQTAIQPEDAKCLIPSAALGLSVTPTPHDHVRRADGSTWNVISVGLDLARSLWTLQLRRP